MTKNGSLRLLAASIGCLALCACGEKRAAEQMVLKGLKDPDSAKFGEFYYNKVTKKACLTVNAKNTMGGYTGDRQFELVRDKEGWQYVDEKDDIGPAVCREEYADKAG